MGTFFSRIFSRLFGRGDVRILILGLENAGKTTFLYQLQFKQAIETIPTLGFNIESYRVNNINLQMWDLGGQKNFRQHWKNYYPNTQGIIYIIDSSDRSRIETARLELTELAHEEDLKNAPILVLANKQDIPGALNESQMARLLFLESLQNNTKLLGISAKFNERVEDGLTWLVENIRN